MERRGVGTLNTCARSTACEATSIGGAREEPLNTAKLTCRLSANADALRDSALRSRAPPAASPAAPLR